MCGRFTATFEFSEIRVRWNLDRDLPKYTPRFNVAPEHSRHCPPRGRQRMQVHALGVDSPLGGRPFYWQPGRRNQWFTKLVIKPNATHKILIPSSPTVSSSKANRNRTLKK